MEKMTVTKYFRQFDHEIQFRMSRIQTLIKEHAPEAEEKISYGMPAYKLFSKPMLYFGGFKKHIGFYCTPSGHEAFKSALTKYTHGKGSVQFPHHQPLPENLIAEMIKFRYLEIKQQIKK
jgi:uncharacterized protein YdhG (YjbR/CyaY superfamily)